MNCPGCSRENPSQARFCMSCGVKFGVRCTKCGTELPTDARFCFSCGQRIIAEALARFDSPTAYTPRHLADKILTSKAALEGERKQVTVLFADVKGSMELLADRDPEEARKILDPVLELMMEAVHRYEGTVNQVMGDGIMALFGAPLAHEDDAVRACYAALRMQEAVARYGDDLHRTHGLDVQIRVGLNSGEVVVRSIGSDLRMDYSAVGQTTHLAARMEQLARPGTTLMSAATVRFIEGYVQVKPLGAMPVKGLSEPAEVYELTGAGPARTRFQAAALRGLTRFVGRDAEIEHLRRALRQAVDGHGQVVAIAGEAGVGKSRLVYEFTRSHPAQGWLILAAAPVSYGQATSYLLVVDLLKSYFKIGDREDHRQIRDKVLGRLLGLDPALESLLAPLLALLDLPVEDPAWSVLDPPQRRQRILDAVKSLLLRESQEQPLLVALEDLHWIDAETQALLDTVVESLGSARLLLLVNYRPEYEHRWGSKTYYSQLRIDSLPVESTAALLHGLLGQDRDLEPLKQMLLKRGNPFFLEETVRTLVETGMLAGAPGAYRLMRSVETLQIPATVQTVLAARIDRLPADEKQLLQAAAVVGKDVPYAILTAIAEQPEAALRRGLAHLRELEFLYETRPFPDLEYTFKHALTHEVAYGSVLTDRRRTLHAQIAEVIERLDGDRSTEHIEWLGHHALRGEMWEKAAIYLQRAGAKAFERSANGEAIRCFEQALSALRRLPDSHARIERAADLHLDLRHALLALGEIEAIFDHLREAESRAEMLGDRRRLGRAFGYLAQNFMVVGDYQHSIESGNRARAEGEMIGDLGIQVLAGFNLGQAHFFVGEYRRAAEFQRRTLDSLTGELMLQRFDLAGYPSVTARAWLAMSLAELGQFADALGCAEAGLQLADEVEQAFTRIVAYWGVGYTYLRKGELARAIPVLERGVMLSQASDLPVQLPIIAPYLAAAYTGVGRLSEAISLLEEAREAAVAMKVMFHRSMIMNWLSETYLFAERADEAAELARHALRLARTLGERGHEAWILRLLGTILANRAAVDHNKADASYRTGLRLATSLGMRPLMAHCHLGLAKLYRESDKQLQADEHFAAATTMYRDMGMTFWLEKSETERAN